MVYRGKDSYFSSIFTCHSSHHIPVITIRIGVMHSYISTDKNGRVTERCCEISFRIYGHFIGICIGSCHIKRSRFIIVIYHIHLSSSSDLCRISSPVIHNIIDKFKFFYLNKRISVRRVCKKIMVCIDIFLSIRSIQIRSQDKVRRMCLDRFIYHIPRICEV